LGSKGFGPRKLFLSLVQGRKLHLLCQLRAWLNHVFACCWCVLRRVPLIIAAPHLTISHGQRTLHIAELVDVYPTVSTLAGLPLPADPLDGISLLPAFLEPAARGNKTFAFSEFPQCPGVGHKYGGKPASIPNLWHTDRGCQSVFRENIGFFGFSIRSIDYRYTEWHPWLGNELRADWHNMTGVELYDYRTVNMSNFDEFDRINVAGMAEHAVVEREMAAALREHFNKM
jgi:iduronate 2-sulfatase